MAIRVSLNHRTKYTYDRLVTLGPQTVRLRPAPHCRTPICSYSLKVTPADHFINWQQDPHGNFLARYVFKELTREFSLEVNLVAELSVINPFDFFLETEEMQFPFTYPAWLDSELASYRKTSSDGPAMEEFLRGIPRNEGKIVDLLVVLNRIVHDRVKYLIRMEPGVQSPEETLTKNSGSCRDSAWLLVEVLRKLGFAARFVSGYLIQLTPDVKSLDGPSGTDRDFTDLHAWAEVYLHGAGWVGLDPTSGLFTGEGHLPLAATPEPASAAPITGGVDECESTFEFHMEVTRIHEDPRVTKPYTDEQWARVESLGRHVDDVLQEEDVRLTMGGEPTFVSIDDMDGLEWNYTAMGTHKRRLAGELFNRLADQFSTLPLMHYGQGKWYPGEPLPRWALACFWRVDGKPIWHNADLIARDGVDYGATDADAKRFSIALAQRLKVNPEFAFPAYEDAWYYMWKERRLPVNVDPLDSKIGTAEERASLARIFEQGLKKVIGFVLPLRVQARQNDLPIWESGPWFLRQEHMFLVPGDSPMGFRLPLDSLPWSVEPARHDSLLERDPFEERLGLPRFARAGSAGHPHSMATGRTDTARREARLVHQFIGGYGNGGYGNGGDGEESGFNAYDEFGEYADLGNHEEKHRNGSTTSADLFARPQNGKPMSRLVRTAICVQPRDGMLHIFMPPTGHLEDYLALIAAVEETAAEIQMPVRVEGYQPPHDTRLTNFKVTPDPGVIEVNMQPAAAWSEVVHNTVTLYEEARLCRLGAEKFMLDGRHSGTGGGNHLVLGGATPSDSPFLRRPDLLQSLVSYWNNRPCLSYLFSGLFIGPTSQAPRVDEARHETLYELETAFSQLPPGKDGRPWIVDRVLRNLLVDITGNTHRAEFCIDKLFSPDSSAGRLGLVEFRGFEMPPHAQMSLAQQLLVRALTARFWKKPYKEALVRWGTSLHDRFVLPYFVAQDFQEVLEEMRDAGFAFEQDWFNAHFEFRFPILGEVTHRGIQVELRQAIEPWHVLGEEPGGGGTVRNVDSSVERVQIRVRGMTDSRHVIACNGRRVPLHATGTPGEFVAGVRYRAWQPPNCLHPTIGVHAPLTIDIVDGWNDRSIGGCRWHVSHPGGLGFERFPVNSYEAESRRTARFFNFGHTVGTMKPPVREHNPDYPFTLDLRRPVEIATFNE